MTSRRLHLLDLLWVPFRIRLEVCSISGTILSLRDARLTAALDAVRRFATYSVVTDRQVIGAYKKDGFAFLLRVFNETGYLESVTGLDKLYADAEAALDSVDWEEGSDSSGEL